MKLFLVLLALSGLSAVKAASLHDNFYELLGMLPIQEMKDVALKYANEGHDEVINVVKYLQSDDWKNLVLGEVRAIPEYQEIKGYLNDGGVDIDLIFNKINDFIASIDVSKPTKKSPNSLQKMVAEIEGMVDLNPIITKIGEMMGQSPEMLALMAKITDKNTHQLVEKIRHLPEVDKLIKMHKENGVDITPLLDLVYSLLGWH